jgi:hypothetical protein
MNPSGETRNRIISAVSCAPEEGADQTRYSHRTAGLGPVESASKAARADAAQHLAALDPSSAYGCVDWYLYPDPKHERATT